MPDVDCGFSKAVQTPQLGRVSGEAKMVVSRVGAQSYI